MGVFHFGDNASNLNPSQGSDSNSDIKVEYVSGLKVRTRTATSITLKWHTVAKADYYVVQCYNSKTKKWEYKGKVNSPTRAYTVKKLKKNTSYKFRVVAKMSTASGDVTIAKTNSCKAKTLTK